MLAVKRCYLWHFCALGLIDEANVVLCFSSHQFFFSFVEDKEKGVCVVVVGEAPEIVCVGIQRRKENECVPTGS